ncbi:MAG: hypothetical protein JOZ46_07765 [Candidatus Dormibacteraeota bacterium]|nr:hypothetical protein [Candidatus Dormibacteraeota bacterium]MBV9525695.1 hypothetical protein [Candidatus Dormibacteraeota bacterium]
MASLAGLRLAALTAGCLLAACGGSSSTGGSSSAAATSTAHTPGANLDACTALTQAAAAQLTGDSAVAKIGGGATTGTNTCVYGDTSSTGGGGATITIEAVPGGVAGQALQAALAQAVQNGNGTAQSLSGVGDQALKEVGANSAGIVFVKGNTLVILGVSSTTQSGTAMEPDLENLARQTAGSL